ncbi:HAD family hydrolase [Niabella soli]|uniref:HAD family hydrolase n=1 Tax=Niabella soli DSM 19437 TaxID=929713 RepID=W0F286_9BACT|nr:HAD family hydrolase [Niabella soli]AHF15918.1 HAD family hydrolase [Niabella soli DSM 19437]
MVKLIVTDLDGSLLNDKKELPADFWKIEKVLRERDVVFCIASGRPHHNLVNLFKPISAHTYFLSDNGSYVTYGEEALLVKTLDSQIVKTLTIASRGLTDVYPVLCGMDKAYMENHNDALLSQALQYYQSYQIVEDLTKVAEPILKVSLCDLQNAETNSYPHFRKYEKDYKVAVAGERWLDFTAFDANKGAAVQLLQQRLGVGYAETMVLGDYLNDLEMMGVAKYSFAMKNAHPGIIAAASFITEADNNYNGVLRAVDSLLQLKHNFS